MADDLVLSMFIVGKVLKWLLRAVATVFQLAIKAGSVLIRVVQRAMAEQKESVS